MSKFYPNCDADGFRATATEAYCIVMHPAERFYCGHRTKSGALATAWSVAGAKLWGCFNDAKVVADRLRAKDKECIVRRVLLEGP